MKTLLKISLIIACLTFIGDKANNAIDLRYHNYHTANTSLNLRALPSTTSPILITLPPKTSFEPLEAHRNWNLIQVTIDEGTIQGYAATEYLTFTVIKPSDIIYILWAILHVTGICFFVRINRHSGISFVRSIRMKLFSPLMFLQLPRLVILKFVQKQFSKTKFKVAKS